MKNYKFLIPGTNVAFILEQQGSIVHNQIEYDHTYKVKSGEDDKGKAIMVDKTVKRTRTEMDGQEKFVARLVKEVVQTTTYPNGKPGTKKHEKAMKYRIKKHNAWLKRKLKQSLLSFKATGMSYEDALVKAKEECKDLPATPPVSTPKQRTKAAHNKAYAMMVSYINGKAFRKKLLSMLKHSPNKVVVDYNERWERGEDGHPLRKDGKLVWVSSYEPGFTITPTKKRPLNKRQQLKKLRQKKQKAQYDAIMEAHKERHERESRMAKTILKAEMGKKATENKQVAAIAQQAKDNKSKTTNNEDDSSNVQQAA